MPPDVPMQAPPKLSTYGSFCAVFLYTGAQRPGVDSGSFASIGPRQPLRSRVAYQNTLSCHSMLSIVAGDRCGDMATGETGFGDVNFDRTRAEFHSLQSRDTTARATGRTRAGNLLSGHKRRSPPGGLDSARADIAERAHRCRQGHILTKLGCARRGALLK
jgi:hypothetical protein